MGSLRTGVAEHAKRGSVAEIYDNKASTVGQLPHTVGRCPGNSRGDEARLRHVVDEV
jgi:hypothetical protein